MPRQKRDPQAKIIEQNTPGQAMSVLRNLWHAHPDFRPKIVAEIKNALTAVNYHDVANDVESSLDSLDEEELYDRSGPSRTGYHDPGEMAGMMVEEVIDPYQTPFSGSRGFIHCSAATCR